VVDSNPLPLGGLSGQELLVLMDMCLDAEERCERRRKSASERGDEKEVAAAARMGATYRDLRFRLFKAMKDPAATDDVQEVLQQVRRELGRLQDRPDPKRA
jgi:hypothetical protein